MRRVSLLCVVVLLTSCAVPRIFESKVPAPVVKSESQIEAERQGADLIARKIETPVELKPVAASLSSSLGAPKKSLVDVKVFDLPKAANTADADLRENLVKFQKELDDVNRRLIKLQGKDIEGTGISLLGPGITTIVIGLIVLGVVFPPAFTFLLFAFRRLRSTASLVVNSIESAAAAPETAQAVSAIKSSLSNTMDKLHKNVVLDLKKK